MAITDAGHRDPVVGSSRSPAFRSPGLAIGETRERHQDVSLLPAERGEGGAKRRMRGALCDWDESRAVAVSSRDAGASALRR